MLGAVGGLIDIFVIGIDIMIGGYTMVEGIIEVNTRSPMVSGFIGIIVVNTRGQEPTMVKQLVGGLGSHDFRW